jgi:hypothetical protein
MPGEPAQGCHPCKQESPVKGGIKASVNGKLASVPYAPLAGLDSGISLSGRGSRKAYSMEETDLLPAFTAERLSLLASGR